MFGRFCGQNACAPSKIWKQFVGNQVCAGLAAAIKDARARAPKTHVPGYFRRTTDLAARIIMWVVRFEPDLSPIIRLWKAAFPGPIVWASDHIIV